MIRYCKLVALCLFFWMLGSSVSAQRLIEYEAGMGSRNADNPDVWVLYRRVKAVHEGMILYADSALLNTKKNDFTAFRHIKIVLTDTTEIYGDRLFYDGNTKIVNIWGDTVVFIDGATTLKTDKLTFDRNTNIAYYEKWGRSTNKDNTLTSRIGRYNATLKEFNIYDSVVLSDTSSALYTDTLIYNTITNEAHFTSPTHIYSDSTHIYSEQGSYNTVSNYAVSWKASRVESGEKILTCDTLHYYENTQYGKAFGHVLIVDTLNDITCSGRYGESNQQQRFSFVTDSALVVFVDKGDSLFLHADTLYVTNNDKQEFETVRAHYHVKVFRNDVQGMCDSAFYSVRDSLVSLYKHPVIWYEHYQCTADTIHLYLDTAGLKLANLRGNSFAIEQVDLQKFNQVRGKNADVYFREGEPLYTDILSNAQMVYYITETGADSNQTLVGVNVGKGSDMRIYFTNRRPNRVVTFGNPDMQTYPYDKLPADQKQLQGFEWLQAHRPQKSSDVFMKTTSPLTQERDKATH